MGFKTVPMRTIHQEDIMKNLRMLIAISLLLTLIQTPAPAQDQAAPKLAKADIEQLMKSLSNWGRWGKDDQKGTINYITAQTRLSAAQLVQEGFAVSLGRNADKVKSPNNSRPYEHQIKAAKENQQWNSDSIKVAYHGHAHTHIDALCHKLYQGKLYNGFSYKEITDKGAAKNSIMQLKDGIFTRAVLFDIPLLKSKEYLADGEAIYPADLDAWEKKTGVKVSQGDIVLVRTGYWLNRKANGPHKGRLPGLHASCLKWFHDRKIAMLGTDIALDVVPSQVPGASQPVHQIALVAMGMPILDCADLGKVSIEAAKRKRWTFLLTFSTLRVEGATGSPVNPIAIF
jgi:kynurenine formamidase